MFWGDLDVVDFEAVKALLPFRWGLCKRVSEVAFQGADCFAEDAEGVRLIWV